MLHFTGSSDSTRYAIKWNEEFDCFTATVMEFDGCLWVMLIDGDIEGASIEECMEGVDEFLQLVDAAA